MSLHLPLSERGFPLAPWRQAPKLRKQSKPHPHARAGARALQGPAPAPLPKWTVRVTSPVAAAHCPSPVAVAVVLQAGAAADARLPKAHRGHATRRTVTVIHSHTGYQLGGVDKRQGQPPCRTAVNLPRVWWAPDAAPQAGPTPRDCCSATSTRLMAATALGPTGILAMSVSWRGDAHFWARLWA